MRHIDDIESSLPQRIERSKIEQKNEADIPLTIRNNISIISRQYPVLLDALNEFIAVYKNHENNIFEQESTRNFEQNNNDLKRRSETILSRADIMVLNIVPIIIFNYDDLT